jgi:hypothetical protein
VEAGRILREGRLESQKHTHGVHAPARVIDAHELDTSGNLGR